MVMILCPKKSEVSYSSSISACEKGSQWQMAMGFLVKIQRRLVTWEVKNGETRQNQPPSNAKSGEIRLMRGDVRIPYQNGAMRNLEVNER